MSFGWSANDVIGLAKLAYTTVQNCRKACGEYDDLTRQMESLRSVIRKLRDAAVDSKSLLNRGGKDSCWEELRPSLEGSREVLQSLNAILVKYASINRKDKMIGRLWTRAKFGNKELGTLNDLRQKAKFFTGTISTLLNTVAVGSLGRIENSLDEAGLRDIKPAIEVIASRLISLGHGEGSVLTAYTNDDRAVWKELRRELVKEKIVPSDIISKNKGLITQFIRELGERGVLDDHQTQISDIESVTGNDGGIQHDGETQSSSREDESPHEEIIDELPNATFAPERQDSVHRSYQQPRDISQIATSRLREHRFRRDSSSRQASCKDSDEDSLASDNHLVESHEGSYVSSSFSLATSNEWASVFDVLVNRLSSNEGAAPEDVEQPVHREGFDQCTDQKHGALKRLSVGSMLKMDLGHEVPELVANLALLDDIVPLDASTFRERYGLERDSERAHIIFIGTPWGLCLFSDSYNLSLYLENFKFFFVLLLDCLWSIESRSSVPDGAMKDGGPRYGLETMTQKLRKCQSLAVTEMRNVRYNCNHNNFHFPVVGDPFDQSEVSTFCDQFLQRTYDFKYISTESQEHGNTCINKLVFSICNWMALFYLNCGDIIRFILTLSNPSHLGPSQVNQWIQQCVVNETEASIHVMYAKSRAKKGLTDGTAQHEAQKSPREELEALSRRLNYFVSRLSEFTIGPETNLQARQEYFEIKEGLEIEVIQGFQKLMIHDNDRLTKKRDREFDRACKALEFLDDV